MKIKLIGGPNHGEEKEITIQTGNALYLPVKYENASYLGSKICDDSQCPDRGKHNVEIWRDTFYRLYEAVTFYKDGIIDKTQYHYKGESASPSLFEVNK